MPAKKKTTAKRKKVAKRKPANKAKVNGRGGDPPGVKRNALGHFQEGGRGIGGRNPGSLNGVVACKRFLAMKLDKFCEPGGDFDKMITARCQTNEGREWLWQNVFADFVRKLPPTAGTPVVVFNVGIGSDRPFPVGMDRLPMIEQEPGRNGSNGNGANGNGHE